MAIESEKTDVFRALVEFNNESGAKISELQLMVLAGYLKEQGLIVVDAEENARGQELIRKMEKLSRIIS